MVDTEADPDGDQRNKARATDRKSDCRNVREMHDVRPPALFGDARQLVFPAGTFECAALDATSTWANQDDLLDEQNGCEDEGTVLLLSFVAGYPLTVIP